MRNDRSLQITYTFRKYHSEHPEVYDKLVELAYGLQERGLTAGIGTLWEVLRHDFLMQGLGKTAKGLNNNYRSRYARLIMFLEPDLKGFFQTRSGGIPAVQTGS